MLADAEEIMSQTDGEYDSPEFVSICKEIEKIEKEIERVNREITHRNVAFEHIQRALAGPLRRTPKLKPRRGIGSY
jgi:peptidoglycan hydrolase CwlO-like protein